MKKGYIVLIVIAVVVLSIFFWFKGAYNGMVNMREAVSAQWSNVENQYQRRLDLIPNLVNTVKGYASHEENTLTEVVEIQRSGQFPGKSHSDAIEYRPARRSDPKKIK